MSPKKMKYIIENEPEKLERIIKRNYIYLEDTTDDDIEKATREKLDIVTAVKAQMDSDVENETANIIRMYAAANAEERAIADYLLVQLCGYTLHTIINDFAEKSE